MSLKHASASTCCAALLALCGMSLQTAHAQGVFSTSSFTGDADSGISSTKTYTHAVDLNGSGETINGVAFAAGGAGTQNSLNYTLGIDSTGTYTGNANALTGSINKLATDFFYSTTSAGSESLLLSGLTPSTTYTLTFYCVGFGSAGGRQETLTDSQNTTPTIIDENASGSGNGFLLKDTYTTAASGAGSTSYQINFRVSAGGSFHEYGFSNEVAASTVTRDPFLWPFAQNSIWNQPIGSSAQYYALNLPAVGQNRTDWEYLSQTTSLDPARNDYSYGSTLGLTIKDNDPIVTSADDRSTNAIVGIVQPDGHLYQLQGASRPNPATDINGLAIGWSYYNSWAYTDLLGTGYFGSHTGSGLSGMGGAVRAWELASGDEYVIRHALKIELDQNFLWKNPSNAAQSYVWPARQADGSTNGYGAFKDDPALEMGSLLALPAGMTPAMLGIQTAAGRKLFHALQDYGAYVVDTSGVGYKNNGNYILSLCAERASREVFDMDTTGAFLSDISLMEQNLYAITNNGPSSIGGGGTPRRALAPPFAPVVGIANASFETPGLGTGSSAYQYSPVGASWSFSTPAGSAGAGFAGNSSAFSNPNAPDGQQAAFVQESGSMSQNVPSFAAASYTLTVSGAQRTAHNPGGPQSVDVYLDSTKIGTIAPTSGAFADYSVSLGTVSAGSHALRFQGTNTNGDSTAFLDKVRIVPGGGGGGTLAALPRTGWTASASSQSNNAPSVVLDGNLNTLWQTGAAQTNGQYFVVNMASARSFSQITLDTGTPVTDYPHGYQVFVSTDGTNWGTAIASNSSPASGEVTTITFPQQSGKQYIKVVQTGSSSSWWSIAEFNVYN